MHKTAFILAILCSFALAQAPSAAPPQPPRTQTSSLAKPAGAPRRNPALESRIRAVLAKSNGVFGVSVRHLELNEAAGVNEDERFQMASVFKIPVLLELFHQVEQGKLKLEQRVEFAHPEHYFGSGVLTTLNPGLQPTLRDLATLMIIVSDNAATDMVCERVGLENVNARLRALGASKTSIEACTRDLILRALGMQGQPTGSLTTENLNEALRTTDPAQRRAAQQQFLRECPNCTTPAEMTMLLEKLVTGQAAAADSSEQMLRMLSQQNFNHRLPRWVPGGIRFAHKTGSLNGPVWVVNDAGIMYLPGGQHVIISVFSHGAAMDEDGVVLKSGITNAEDRIAEIGKLVEEYYSARP